MKWTDTLWNLRDVLAELYPTVGDSQQILDQAEVPKGKIAFNSASQTNWYNILNEADKHKMIGDIVEEAKKEYPREEALQRYLEKGDLPGIRSADIEEPEWQAPTESDTLEKIIGNESTLLPISFFEQGLEKARSVARIVRQDGLKGTGFLIAGNRLITNHHVLGSDADAAQAIAQFNYQETASGLPREVEEFRFAPEGALGFATSEEDDWTVVQVEGNPNDKWGAIPLERADPQVKDRVNIIQHPMGLDKQIALYHNIVVYVGPKRLQYLTDTLKGSSGSPVFDQDWKIVALHHRGGNLREPGTKKIYWRNQGIHINTIIDGIAAAGL